MPPVIARPCSIDLWQLRSQSAISLSPTHADMIARFDADVPFSHRVRAVRAEHARGVALALTDRARVAEHRAERAALDAHVGAKQVLAVEVEERAADRRLQERDAALVARRGPRVLALAVVARQRCGKRRQQVARCNARSRSARGPPMNDAVSSRIQMNSSASVRDLDAHGARELAAGHQENRHVRVARSHRAQQLGRLLVRAGVVVALRPVQQDAVNARNRTR